MNSNEVKELLECTNRVITEYDKHFSSGDMNIFSTMKKERYEVTTHSIMLYSLLSNKYFRKKDNLYLKLFLNELKLDEKIINSNWQVEREWITTNDGRIDFLLKCSEKCVVIELKIDALDEEHQLKRYENYVKTVNSNYEIVYLTLNGKKPSEQSANGIDGDKLKLLSFKDNIINWLNNCLKETAEDLQVYSYIQQYLFLVQKIAGEEKMIESIDNLIDTPESLRCAIEISNRINPKKSEILVKFMKGIYEGLKEKDLDVSYDENATKDYYKSSTKKLPTIYIRISQENDIDFCSLIRIDDSLYYNFGFYKVNNDNKNFEKLEISQSDKLKYKEYCEIGDKLKNKTSELRTAHGADGFWKYLTDGKDKYNFKKFTPNCLQLIDKENMANSIASIVNRVYNIIKV